MVLEPSHAPELPLKALLATRFCLMHACAMEDLCNKAAERLGLLSLTSHRMLSMWKNTDTMLQGDHFTLLDMEARPFFEDTLSGKAAGMFWCWGRSLAWLRILEAFVPEDLSLLEQPAGANTMENPTSMQIQYAAASVRCSPGAEVSRMPRIYGE